MPELPEVESYRSVIEDHCLGKTILDVEVLVPSLLKGTTPAGFIRIFKRQRFKETLRHGKYLFAGTTGGHWMFFHFGLTGDLTFEKEIPRFTAVAFRFSRGLLCFSDMRKFGRFGIVEDPAEFLREKKWGPDALSIHAKDFTDRLKKRAIAVKTALMDQKIVAGIGNEYSDEILFRAKVHPEKKASTLSAEKLNEIFKITRSVLKAAIKAEAERSKMKKFHFVVNRKPGLACPVCGTMIRSITVGGRTSYFCPYCQKKKSI